MKKFIRQKKLSNIAPKHCFEVTLTDIEQIINNKLIQLEAEWLSDNDYFSSDSNNLEKFLRNFFKKLFLNNKNLEALQKQSPRGVLWKRCS